MPVTIHSAASDRRSSGSSHTSRAAARCASACSDGTNACTSRGAMAEQLDHRIGRRGVAPLQHAPGGAVERARGQAVTEPREQRHASPRAH
jgi:hypothetical protein